jgi:hypothetical protein
LPESAGRFISRLKTICLFLFGQKQDPVNKSKQVDKGYGKFRYTVAIKSFSLPQSGKAIKPGVFNPRSNINNISCPEGAQDKRGIAQPFNIISRAPTGRNFLHDPEPGVKKPQALFHCRFAA